MMQQKIAPEIRNIVLLVTLSAMCFVFYAGYTYWKVAVAGKRGEVAMQCLTLAEKKSSMYFSTQIGKSRALFSPKTNSCLLFNSAVGNDGSYTATLVDMYTDRVIDAYTLPAGQEKDSVYGITPQAFIEKIKSYGFQIIS